MRKFFGLVLLVPMLAGAALAGLVVVSHSSAAAPATRSLDPGTRARVMSSVTYGYDDGPLLADLYLPAGSARPAPVVLVVHGGGWAGGSRADTAPEAEALARAGLAALNVDYRLATPSHPAFPGELSDLDQALAWMRSQSGSLRLDAGRVGVLGLSSGGNLALDLGARGLARAVVSWSAPTDLAAFEVPGGQCTSPACGPLSLPWAVYQYLGCLPSHCPAAYRAASPAEAVTRRGARLQIWNSTDELVPLSQADAIVEAARTAGVPADERVLEGDLHAGQYAAAALGPSIGFLATTLAA